MLIGHLIDPVNTAPPVSSGVSNRKKHGAVGSPTRALNKELHLPYHCAAYWNVPCVRKQRYLNFVFHFYLHEASSKLRFFSSWCARVTARSASPAPTLHRQRPPLGRRSIAGTHYFLHRWCAHPASPPLPVSTLPTSQVPTECHCYTRGTGFLS